MLTKENSKKFFCIAIPVIISGMIWFQLELSCNYDSFFRCFQMEGKYIILNILTHLVVIIGLIIIINRIWMSCLIYSLTGTIIAIVNYYVITLHGVPLTILELKNFKTAMNVMDSYKIEVTPRVGWVLAILLVNIVLCICAKKCEEGKLRSVQKTLFRDAILVGICALVLYIGFFSPNSIKPEKVVGWLWTESYPQYGYIVCSLEMIEQMYNAVDKPEGYSDEKVKNILVDKDLKSNQTPDIILILNETFYDLEQITEIQTDVPVRENIDSMDNLIKGHVVVPIMGGGTNNSEYELLTSNSVQLMQGITPFNVLDMDNANSIVSHLEQLGYHTIGAHSQKPENYSRGRAYAAMGFDEIFFGDDFFEKEYYADRIWYETDESLYNNLIHWYEEFTISDNPQFIYLLTMQNHGGWDINAPQDDIVHVQNNFGNYTEVMNEYLSCIKMSDEAFKNLTEYFLAVERPVIVCMVGDHSPSFAIEVVGETMDASEADFRLRSTPFVIWANYNIEDEDMGYISMNYLMPTVLEVAQVNTSPYYQHLIHLRKQVPVLTSWNYYIDTAGNKYGYTDSWSPYAEMVNNYLYMEYNNMQTDRQQKLFDAYVD